MYIGVDFECGVGDVGFECEVCSMLSRGLLVCRIRVLSMGSAWVLALKVDYAEGWFCIYICFGIECVMCVLVEFCMRCV